MEVDVDKPVSSKIALCGLTVDVVRSPEAEEMLRKKRERAREIAAKHGAPYVSVSTGYHLL